jgi:NAD(P)-dependent dehydrogenase (short-subunit alcohol dehydrogenase family)
MYGVANKAVSVAAVAASALDLKSKTVAVIGGTSGVGRALALCAASKGAAVTVVGRSFKARAPARGAARASTRDARTCEWDLGHPRWLGGRAAHAHAAAAAAARARRVNARR